MNWSNLPLELKERQQWCLAAPPGMYSKRGKEPLGIKSDGTFYFASVKEPGTWMSFEQASYHGKRNNLHIGYVLNEDDPFSCIDFDIKDAENYPDVPQVHTTRQQYEFYLDSIRRFDSYTERSVSGKGFHVWVKAQIGRGARGEGIEIYSQERFIISTGDIINAKGIENRQDQLIAFKRYISPKEDYDNYQLVEIDPVDDDWYVLERAFNAVNEVKFSELWYGDWKKHGYPSQSEADLAILSMLAFYTDSNAQVRRLFRNCALGQREKATKNNDYLNLTLKVIRSRMALEHAALEHKKAISSGFFPVPDPNDIIKEEINKMQGLNLDPIEVHPLTVSVPTPEPKFPNTSAIIATAAPLPASIIEAGEEGIPWPPGVAGRIAHFVYQSAPKPVKEVAIVASIGLLAGICGKAWHIAQSGLNMYITLIAQSGVGKEAMHSGISNILSAVNQVNPMFYNFVSFDDFASGPALTKSCAMNPCFVNVSGEWGHKLKRMAQADSGKDTAMTTLRQVMTNLYQKSGPKSMFGGIRYSNVDNNIASVSGVAYSMIGETTPGIFYESLTESMMEDGFLSRFLSIEYNGIRVRSNKNQIITPDKGLITVLSDLAQAASNVTAGGPSTPVASEPQASEYLDQFEQYCDDQVNATTNEGYRQMYSRAALKSARLAALLAVADDHRVPIVRMHHMHWAIDIICRDIHIMKRHIETGDVGITDSSRQRKLISVLEAYKKNPLMPSFIQYQKFKDRGCIPRRYLQQLTSSYPAFAKFKGGSINALNITIQSLIDDGTLSEVSKADAFKDFSFHGKCYRILGV